MKYFVLGALASGMLLYGMSMIYGATGTLDIAAGGATPSPTGGAARRHAGVRAGVRRRRPRLQAGRGAVPHVGAGRLPRRADRGDAVHRHGAQARRVRLRHAAAGAGARRRALVADWQQMLVDHGGAVAGDRQPHRHRADQPQAHARLLDHLAHGLHAARHSVRATVERLQRRRCSTSWSTC